MKIVVLDGETTNPGDLSWERLEKLGELTVYARTKPEELYERAKEAELLITNKTVLSGKMIRSLKNLKYIGTLSTGFNVVDIHAARELGIPVCNVPSYCTNAVAQMTFSLLFALTNHVALHNHSVHQGDWENSTDFCYWKAPLVELESKNFGVYGFGSIGRTVAKLAADLGMNVLVYSRTKRHAFRLPVGVSGGAVPGKRRAFPPLSLNAGNHRACQPKNLVADEAYRLPD